MAVAFAIVCSIGETIIFDTFSQLFEGMMCRFENLEWWPYGLCGKP